MRGTSCFWRKNPARSGWPSRCAAVKVKSTDARSVASVSASTRRISTPNWAIGWACSIGGKAMPPRRRERCCVTDSKISACIAFTPPISNRIRPRETFCRSLACNTKAASAGNRANGASLLIPRCTASCGGNCSRKRRVASRMPDAMAVQVTIYLNEADQWHHRPLHMEILNYLRKENVYAATAIHCVAGFLGRQRVETAHLVEAGGKLPVIIIFVDTDEHVNRVLPTLKEMAAHRLIVRENVVLEQGSLD